MRLSVRSVVVPDTDTILRYLIGNPPEHYAQACEVFDKVLTGEVQALILESVLTECIYVLTKHYQVPRDEAGAQLTKLLEYRGVINKEVSVWRKALALFGETRLDIVDCLIVATAKSKGYRAFSFDRNLLKLERKETS